MGKDHNLRRRIALKRSYLLIFDGPRAVQREIEGMTVRVACCLIVFKTSSDSSSLATRWVRKPRVDFISVILNYCKPVRFKTLSFRRFNALSALCFFSCNFYRARTIAICFSILFCLSTQSAEAHLLLAARIYICLRCNLEL